MMRRLIARILPGLALAIAIAGCAATEQQQAVTLTDWIGKRRREVVAQFGQPTQAIPLIETGGEALLYAKSGQPSYYFEMGPQGVITKAIEMK